MKILISRSIACFRAFRLVLHLFHGAFLALFYPSLRSSQQKYIFQSWSKKMLDILNVRLSLSGEISLQLISPGLVVANHISWLDIFVLSSVLPMRFVAKSEVRQWPLIGWLCARAQTIFIERNKRSDTVRTNQLSVATLNQGNCMAFFPEGTTTDGSHVKHFHASLLQPAIDADTAIYPVAIFYHDKHNKLNLDAAYVDDMSFAESVWKILCSRDLHVRIVTTTALPTQGENRRVLAQQAQHCISHALSGQLTIQESEISIKQLDEPEPILDSFLTGQSLAPKSQICKSL